jgi:hypothetical protein
VVVGKAVENHRRANPGRVFCGSRDFSCVDAVTRDPDDRRALTRCGVLGGSRDIGAVNVVERSDERAGNGPWTETQGGVVGGSRDREGVRRSRGLRPGQGRAGRAKTCTGGVRPSCDLWDMPALDGRSA